MESFATCYEQRVVYIFVEHSAVHCLASRIYASTTYERQLDGSGVEVGRRYRLWCSARFCSFEDGELLFNNAITRCFEYFYDLITKPFVYYNDKKSFG